MPKPFIPPRGREPSALLRDTVKKFLVAAKAGGKSLAKWWKDNQESDMLSALLAMVVLPGVLEDDEAVIFTRNLLKAGLDPNAAIPEPGPSRSYGQSALLRPAVLRVLLDTGTLQVHQRQLPDNGTLFHSLVNLWSFCRCKDAVDIMRGYSCVPSSVFAESARMLLAVGADPNLTDEGGGTPLLYLRQLVAQIANLRDDVDLGLLKVLMDASVAASSTSAASQASRDRSAMILRAVKLSSTALVRQVRDLCARLDRAHTSQATEATRVCGGGYGDTSRLGAAEGGAAPSGPPSLPKVVDFPSRSVTPLKEALRALDVDPSGCVESHDLVDVLMSTVAERRAQQTPRTNPASPLEQPSPQAATEEPSGSSDSVAGPFTSDIGSSGSHDMSDAAAGEGVGTCGEEVATDTPEEARLHMELGVLLETAAYKLVLWDDIMELLPATAFPRHARHLLDLAHVMSIKNLASDEVVSPGFQPQEHEMPKSALVAFTTYFRAHPNHVGLYCLMPSNFVLKGAVCCDSALRHLMPSGLHAFLDWVEHRPEEWAALDERDQVRVVYAVSGAVSWTMQVHDFDVKLDQWDLFESPFVTSPSRYHILLVRLVAMGFDIAFQGLCGLAHISGAASDVFLEIAASDAALSNLTKWITQIAEALQSCSIKALDPDRDHNVAHALMVCLLGVTSRPRRGRDGGGALLAPIERFEAALSALMASEVWGALEAMANISPSARVFARLKSSSSKAALNEVYQELVTLAACLTAAVDPRTSEQWPSTATQFLPAWRSAKAYAMTLTFPDLSPSSEAAQILQRTRALLLWVNEERMENMLNDRLSTAKTMHTAMAKRKAVVRGMTGCWQCGATADDLGVEKLLRCSQCHEACYCSKECQKQHWKLGHKATCKTREMKVTVGNAGSVMTSCAGSIDTGTLVYM